MSDFLGDSGRILVKMMCNLTEGMTGIQTGMNKTAVIQG
jgi:hypothetical protein